jgi:ribonuclease HI
MKRVEKIPTTGRDPSKTGELPFCIRIPADKEALAREAKNATEEIQVFTDSSAQGGKVGAAAILIRKNRPNRMLHFHLGPETEHMVHEAELVGLLLALHLLGSERCGTTTCCIAIDNQAVLRAFNSELRKPGHHLAREILDLAHQIRNRRSKRKYALTLRWTAGHIRIPGNEKADCEAKRAVAGLSSPNEILPPYLRKPLLINPSAVTRKYNDKLKKEWSKEWHNSKRGKKALKINASTPLAKFLKTISNPKLSREGASRIVQLQLQHIPLNGYLHRF